MVKTPSIILSFKRFKGDFQHHFTTHLASQSKKVLVSYLINPFHYFVFFIKETEKHRKTCFSASWTYIRDFL